MAQITINEISQNYIYNVGTNSYAIVALPITSSWGPGYFDVKSYLGEDADEADMLEIATWQKFPSTRAGLDAFVSAYRGPASNYRLANDYSYQVAMTLLSAGYDVLTCRICPGSRAFGTFVDNTNSSNIVSIKAKYPGTFGNKLLVALNKLAYKSYKNGTVLTHYYWNLITYVVDSDGSTTAVENIVFVFELENSTDNILHWSEVESKFLDIDVIGNIKDDASTAFGADKITLAGGSDIASNEVEISVSDVQPADPPSEAGESQFGLRAYENADGTATRYNIEDEKLVVDENGTYVLCKFRRAASGDTGTKYKLENKIYVVDADNGTYVESVAPANTDSMIASYELWLKAVSSAKTRYGDAFDNSACNYAYSAISDVDNVSKMSTLAYREWIFTAVTGSADDNSDGVYSLLSDKLSYNPNRIISPGWDDQDINFITDNDATDEMIIALNKTLSPMHIKLMFIATVSRCATAYIDIPRSLPRSKVWNPGVGATADDQPGYAQNLARYAATQNYIGAELYPTHSALFAPWGSYTYVGSTKQSIASPSVLALLIQRAQILNQSIQYEWALPTNRKHNLKIGKLQYNVTKKYLDEWQQLEGVGVNVIAPIPDLGTNIWGNSTLYEVPPATYQALANLSTRLLVNAIEDIVYRVGISITFQYNNQQAYSAFIAGVSPTLDTMQNVGAIEGYKIEMSADIDGMDQINANTVVGKIYIAVNGVINDINIDLICLPPNADLSQF